VQINLIFFQTLSFFHHKIPVVLIQLLS